jgi:pimeloyl-ACP methyl ester carboxylesterase
MTVEEIQVAVGDDSYPGRLNVPSDGGENGIVLLPGAGHGPYGDIFDRVAAEAAENGYHFLRFRSWESHEELGQKTLGDLHEEIDAAVAFLQALGCTRLGIVGKSFGGRIALTHIPEVVNQLVLWAPAIMAGDESNLEKSRRMDLKEYNRRIDTSTLEAIGTPVRILHGDEDGLPLENSRKLVDGLENGELIEIEGTDHSFLGPGDGTVDATIEHTLEYLATKG